MHRNYDRNARLDLDHAVQLCKFVKVGLVSKRLRSIDYNHVQSLTVCTRVLVYLVGNINKL